MPIMWDRRWAATGSSTSSSLSSRHKQRLASHRHLQNQPLLDPDPTTASTPFNALGISTALYKYRIHAGKVVPDLYNSELSSLPHDGHLDYQHQTILPSDIVDNPDHSFVSRTLSALFKSDREAELYQGVVPAAQMSSAVPSRMAIGQISPPSSPEAVAWRSSPEAEDVSPISPLDGDSDTLDGSNSPRVRRANNQKLNSILGRPFSRRDNQLPMPQQYRPSTNSSQGSPPQQLPQRLPPMQQSHQMPHRPLQPQPDRTSAPPVSLGQRMKRLTRPKPDVAHPQSWGRSTNSQLPQPMATRDRPTMTLNNADQQPRRTPAYDSLRGPYPTAHQAPKFESRKVPAAMRKLLPVKESPAISNPVPYYSSNRSYPSPPHDDMIPQPQKPSYPLPAAAHNLSSMNSVRRKPPPVNASVADVDRKAGHANPLGSSPVYSSASDEGNRRDAGPSRPKGLNTRVPKVKVNAGGLDTRVDRTVPRIIDVGPRQSRVDHSRTISDSPLAVKSAPLDDPQPPKSSPIRIKAMKVRPVSDMPTPVSTDSTASKGKPLPPAPPEATAVDRISQMNAQLSALANRRMNLNKGIKRMTELMPPENLIDVDVLIRREEERKKIEALKSSLAEIQREEHDLGMRLHRAYKRQNKDANYEPTTLWVRRVTG